MLNLNGLPPEEGEISKSDNLRDESLGTRSRGERTDLNDVKLYCSIGTQPIQKAEENEHIWQGLMPHLP